MKVTVLDGKLTKATARAAAWDLYSTQEVLLKPGEQALIETGVRTRMEGCYALLVDRSGLSAKFGVSRRAGLIDPDYDGYWKVVLINEGIEAYTVRKWDRIAQALILPVVEIPVESAEFGEVEVNGVVRGSGGFGSSGQ